MAVHQRLHVIACGVLAIDIKQIAQDLGRPITTHFLEGGLHNTPGELRRRLQAAIDEASAAGSCDAIAVGYGVCGRGTVGIHAGSVPLIIPRVHDCIALFLGSNAAYRREFSSFPGTFYVSAGWFTEQVQPKAAPTDSSAKTSENDAHFAKLAGKYGEENARAIIDFMNSWRRNYQRAAFIDTGSQANARYAEYARAMAEEFGWRYDELPGSLPLLERILTATQTSDDVLVVPPHHVTAFDPISAGLAAVPVWEGSGVRPGKLPAAPAAKPHLPRGPENVRIGLGIDAGGTYTDVVLYDFETENILCKGKALTTKWDYTAGIEQALAALDAETLRRTDLVSVSTTLATNAIIEGRGQAVGLLVMPPYGLYRPSDFPHDPKAAIAGRLEIDGSEISPIDPDEIRRVACAMTKQQKVGAFAVSGYAGTINPAHELAVKRILRDETGLSVTCGHELSEILNFRTRADTAVLNARIIPRLEAFLRDVERSLHAREISAPVMVVKGDGSLMNVDTARERPVETILSGPAASVAGAIRLTGLSRAFVMDVGGTTSDTASVRNGHVKTCTDGARVGGWKTHVRALDMRTIGLGGDSLISYRGLTLRIGPLRVAPAAWLGDRHANTAAALDYIDRHADDFSGATLPSEMLTLTGHVDKLELTPHEQAIIRCLADRPMSLAELARETGAQHWNLLRLQRLEEHYVVQRCGLTPTDILHETGAFQRWHTPTAQRLCGIYSRICNIQQDEFIRQVTARITKMVAIELLKKQLDEETEPDAIDTCPACQTLLANMLAGGSRDYTVKISLSSPVIGLGAPVHHFLPEAARLLDAELIIPDDADVANAIGAITSRVVVSRGASIRPNDSGEYAVVGLPVPRSFKHFEEAHDYAVSQLEHHVRRLAHSAGTSETAVQIAINDRVSSSAEGVEIFLERAISAKLSGPPDIARLAAG